MQVSSAKSIVALTFIPVKFNDMINIHVATEIRVVVIHYETRKMNVGKIARMAIMR